MDVVKLKIQLAEAVNNSIQIKMRIRDLDYKKNPLADSRGNYTTVSLDSAILKITELRRQLDKNNKKKALIQSKINNLTNP